MSKQRISTPFSSISYNTPEFLATQLNEMVVRKVIRFAMWIHHRAEADEKKDHAHLYIEPRGACDPDEVLAMLDEFDPTHPTQPLGCLPYKKSKTDDWVFYGVHDADYLWLHKRQKRQYHYQFDAIHSTNPFFKDEIIHNLDYRWRDSVEVAERMYNGERLESLVFRGFINLGNACQARALSRMIPRKSHTPKDPAPEFYVDDDGQVALRRDPSVDDSF